MNHNQPTPHTMNRILAFLLCLMAFPVMAQTGSGIVLLTEASHTFTPTTVDSTDSFSFQLVNEVGVSQTVFFGTLEPPFSLVDNAPVEIASLDTLEVTVSSRRAPSGRTLAACLLWAVSLAAQTSPSPAKASKSNFNGTTTRWTLAPQPLANRATPRWS